MDKLRVLAFTTSRCRPFYLRCCLLQMAQQSYGVDHAIYMNAPQTASEPEFFNYKTLLEDITPAPGHQIFLGYGLSLKPHLNHIEALKLSTIDHYDLFLKVDDDDVYHKNYVKAVVDSYLEHLWDFSGSFTQGLVNQGQWLPERCYHSLGLTEKDKQLGVIPMMPPTFAFSKKAIKAIMDLDLGLIADPAQFEDIIWRQFLTVDPRFKVHFRDQSEYVYQVHEHNFSASNEIKV